MLPSNSECQESNIPSEKQTHRDQISLNQRVGEEWGYQNRIL